MSWRFFQKTHVWHCSRHAHIPCNKDTNDVTSLRTQVLSPLGSCSLQKDSESIGELRSGAPPPEGRHKSPGSMNPVGDRVMLSIWLSILNTLHLVMVKNPNSQADPLYIQGLHFIIYCLSPRVTLKYLLYVSILEKFVDLGTEKKIDNLDFHNLQVSCQISILKWGIKWAPVLPRNCYLHKDTLKNKKWFY